MPTDRRRRVTVRVIVAARNESARIEATLASLRRALPGAELWVADDGSATHTARDRAAGGRPRRVAACRHAGKGAAVTAAARDGAVRRAGAARPGDGCSCSATATSATRAGELGALVGAVRDGGRSLAIACLRERAGGGFGLARGFARWAIGGAAGSQHGRRSPVSGRSSARAARATAAVRRGLRDGAGHDDRRGPRRALAWSSSSCR